MRMLPLPFYLLSCLWFVVAAMTVGGVDVEFGYTNLGATLDITPPLTAHGGATFGNGCHPLGHRNLSNRVFVHEGG